VRDFDACFRIGVLGANCVRVRADFVHWQVGYLTDVRCGTPNRVHPYNLDSCHETIKLTGEVSLSMALRQNRAS